MANDERSRPGRAGNGLIEMLDDELLEEAELDLGAGEAEEFEDEATSVFQPGVHDTFDSGGFEEEATQVFDPGEHAPPEEFEDEATRVWQHGAPEPVVAPVASPTARAAAAAHAARAGVNSASHYAAGSPRAGGRQTQIPQSGVSATTGSRPAIDAGPMPEDATVVTDSAAVFAQSAAARAARPQVALPRASAAVPVAPSRKGNGAMIAMIGILVVALVAVAFVFLQGRVGSGASGTVALFSSPAGATVTVDGQRLPNTTPTTLADLALGESHVVKLELAGYQPIEETIVVTTEGLQQRQFELHPSTGTVTIRTVPEGAAISVDGQARGVAPVSVEGLDVEAAHEIVATLTGHDPARRTVSFSAAGPREQLVALTLQELAPPAPPEGSGDTADGSGAAVVAAADTDSEPPASAAASSRSSDSRASSSRSSSSSDRPSRPSARSSERPSRPSASRPSTPRERPSGARPSAAAPAAPAAPPAPAAPEPSGVGTISVQAVPFGQVWVDGRMVAPETPLINHELSSGVHRVKVYYVNLRQFSEERSIRVEPGENRTTTFRAAR